MIVKHHNHKSHRRAQKNMKLMTTCDPLQIMKKQCVMSPVQRPHECFKSTFEIMSSLYCVYEINITTTLHLIIFFLVAYMLLSQLVHAPISWQDL